MATLVLGTIGQAVAGPIGGAIGSIAGQVIDRAWLGPPGREGPRLGDLAVQGSSYGAAIPRIHGTMRVAGQVVWATDLKETATVEGGGKGAPEYTSYSYSVSLAVLLSGRAIRRVGRIWADGTLLRGAAGDWKSEAGAFRWHGGDEDQAVDPLIASAEGIARTPALRGCAYAVFENWPLAGFGNRIPSFTFEVEADVGPVAIGAIVEAASGGAVRSDIAEPVAGFAVHGGSLGGALSPLIEVAGARLSVRDGLPWATAGADGGEIVDKGRAERSMVGLERVPRRVTLRHHDPARDWQAGTQAAAREGAGLDEARVELAAAIEAGAARRLAEAMLARAAAGRVTRTVRMPWVPGGPGPGDRVSVAGDPARWRVAGSTLERMELALSLVREAGGSAPALPADSGAVPGEDVVVPATLATLFELPPVEDRPLAAPRLWVAACGAAPGWRGATVSVRSDVGAWTVLGRVRREAVMGTVVVPPLAGVAAELVDMRSSVEVALAHEGMGLMDADAAALAAGANAALIGDELVQFARAEPLGGGRWRLSRLWRGRGGSEAMMAAHGAGDRFVLLDAGAMLAIDGRIGAAVEVTAIGPGDAVAVSAATGVTGRSVAPPSPVHGRIASESGGLRVRWVRRSRAGWDWPDGVDAPLGEEAERYRLTVVRADGDRRDLETTTPEWLWPAGEMAADRAAGPVRLEVRQIGSLAPSEPLVMVI